MTECREERERRKGGWMKRREREREGEEREEEQGRKRGCWTKRSVRDRSPLPVTCTAPALILVLGVYTRKVRVGAEGRVEEGAKSGARLQQLHSSRLFYLLVSTVARKASTELEREGEEEVGRCRKTNEESR